MAALEEQIAVPLFERARGGLRPTAAGDTLLRQARNILATMERMHIELAEFSRGAHGSIRVLASLSALSEFLPDDVGTFLAQHPKLRVSLDERVSSEIVQGVRDGSADFGVCWDAGELKGLELLPYRADHLCVVAPALHPLARRKRLAFVDSLAFDQIEILAGSIVQKTLRRTAAIAGETVRYRIQVSTFDAACRSVAAGLGVAVVPREVAQAFATSLRLHLIPLTDPWAERRFVLCVRSRESLTDIAKMLVDFLHARAAAA
jgi:DNA-binding transcriptional LysR family regulator